MCIHIGPWILDLSSGKEHIGDHLIEIGNDLEHGVVGEELGGKLPLAGIPGVSLPKHPMAIPWDDLPLRKRGLDVSLELLLGRGRTQLTHKLVEPSHHLLVGEAVEGAGKPVHAGGKGEVGVGESAPHQVAGVGRDVASLVVAVDRLDGRD